MKAHVSKSEKSSFFGGKKYILDARIELSRDEQAIVKRHDISYIGVVGVGGHHCDRPTQKKILEMGGNRLKTYLRGFHFEFEELADLDSYEFYLMCEFERVKKTCAK